MNARVERRSGEATVLDSRTLPYLDAAALIIVNARERNDGKGTTSRTYISPDSNQLPRLNW